MIFHFLSPSPPSALHFVFKPSYITDTLNESVGLTNDSLLYTCSPSLYKISYFLFLPLILRTSTKKFCERDIYDERSKRGVNNPQQLCNSDIYFAIYIFLLFIFLFDLYFYFLLKHPQGKEKKISCISYNLIFHELNQREYFSPPPFIALEVLIRVVLLLPFAFSQYIVKKKKKKYYIKQRAFMSIRSDISMRLIPEVMKTTWLGETVLFTFWRECYCEKKLHFL